MIRRDFLSLMSLTGALISLPTSDVGYRADEAPVDAQAATPHLWQVYGLAKAKRSVYPLVRDHLSDLAYTLGRPHPEFRHRAICAEAADLYQLAGEIYFDGNRYTQAAECYALAASASKEARNADLWAAALTRHAFIGICERRFRQTKPLLDAAGLLACKETASCPPVTGWRRFRRRSTPVSATWTRATAHWKPPGRYTTSTHLALVAGYGSTAPAWTRNAAVAT